MWNLSYGPLSTSSRQHCFDALFITIKTNRIHWINESMHRSSFYHRYVFSYFALIWRAKTKHRTLSPSCDSFSFMCVCFSLELLFDWQHGWWAALSIHMSVTWIASNYVYCPVFQSLRHSWMCCGSRRSCSELDTSQSFSIPNKDCVKHGYYSQLLSNTSSICVQLAE